MKVKRSIERKPNFSPKGLIVKPDGSKWFENVTINAPKTDGLFVSPSLASSLKNEAENLFNQDTRLYPKISEKRKDFAWIQTVLKSGTLCDKISAHVVLVQDSPVHYLDSVVNVINMVSTKGKRECLMAMDTLRDLFLSDLLPENRKLKTFELHPLAEVEQMASKNYNLRNRTLVLWYFEDKLKSIYADFVKKLEAVSHDTVDKTKLKAVSVMAELLRCNPEQEHFLLEHLVNKIGDPLQKVGAHVCHLLGRIMDSHPNMKGVISQEVERLLFRPNICERTKYYCLCILNQIILTHDDKKLANHLIKMYFGLFKVCVKKGEVNNKIMSALLTGVTRAHPYVAVEDNSASEQLNAMYKMIHMVSFNISIQALLLIFQVLDSKDSVSERFYTALYRKLLDPEVGTSSRQYMLLNLIHRALKKDVAGKRVKAFVKRLIQISLYQEPNFQCAILYLVSDLAKTHRDLLNMDKCVIMDSDSDEEEHYEDVLEDDDNEEQHLQDTVSKKTSESDRASQRICPSWVHKQIKDPSGRSKTNYDPLHRNPLYAGAEYSTLWELRFLNRCFHPSVSLFAHQVISDHEIKYSGDPLQDFTLARFLDRFVYRNPKKQTEIKKSDKHRKVFGARKLYIPSGSRQLPVTSDEYLHQDESKIPVEENFIFKFLKQQVLSGKKKKDGEDSDIESINSGEFEEILDKYNAEDEGKDMLDFAKELSSMKPKKSKKKKSDEGFGSLEDDSDLEYDDFEDDSDLEDPEFEDDEMFQEAFEDFDDDLKEADEMKSAFENEDFDVAPRSSQSPKITQKKKKQRVSEENMFAPAEEFARLLESNLEIDSTTAEAFLNKDKADAKQIVWEQKRDQYVRGADWQSKKLRKFKKGPKKFHKGGKKFNRNKK